ncbi:MAG: DUF5916 domain-containing protein [Myxococcota bacterium]|nr:DUF5916 domain-containing protein [Myxococcota bacterium]
MPLRICSHSQRFIPFLLAFVFAAPVFAADEPRARVTWVTEVPVLDGVLDDAAWEQAEEVLDKFTQVYPLEGAEPTQRTEVRIVTDGKMLYLGVRNHDTNPEEMVVNRGLRDDMLFWDDRFNIVVDTFHDHRNGYFFQVNPVGVRRDALLEGSNFEENWNAIWYAETTIDETGWSLEMAIPYQSIAFDPDGDVWGLNIVRGMRRNGESDRWADPVRHRFESNLCCAGTLHGMKGITQGVGLDIVPGFAVRHKTETTKAQQTTPPDGHYPAETNFDPTLDVFYRVTPSLTTSLSINTDFGGTESDEQRVNLSRFALFFPEKREFFLRDALLFDFGGLSNVMNPDPNGRAFFSRRIGLQDDIKAAAKITGRVGDYNIGIIDSQLGGDSDNLLVARISRNILGESRVGMILTNGDPESETRNTLAGVDYEFRDSNWNGTGKVLSSNIWFQNSFTGGGSGLDGAWGAEVIYPNDALYWRLSYKELMSDFNPGLGFVNRRNIRSYDAFARTRTWPGTWVRNYGHGLGAKLVTNRNNRIDSGTGRVKALEISNNVVDYLTIEYRHRFERLTAPLALIEGVTIPAGTYHWDEAEVKFQSSQNRAIRLIAVVQGGTFYNGERLGLRGAIEWRPNWHFFMSFEYDHNELWLDQFSGVAPLQVRSAERARSRIGRVRINFYFTPDISWTTFAQYDNQTDSIGINSRLRWIVEDGSEIFLVLNQGFDVVEDPTRNAFGEMTATSTEAVLKVGWTFRF